jgi:hypothetical protein
MVVLEEVFWGSGPPSLRQILGPLTIVPSRGPVRPCNKISESIVFVQFPER